MKNKLTLSLSVIAVMAAGAASAQDCTPMHDITTVEKGFLTVAAPTFPPFSIPSADGITGIDGEIINEIAARECLKVKVAQVEYATAIPYVVSGRADVAIGDYYRTAERAKVVDLSAPIYLSQMGLYSKEGVTTVAELEGRKVGTVQGYLWVDELKQLLGSNLSLYNNYVALYQDLGAGRIDIGVDGIPVGSAAQKGGALQGIQIKIAEPDERVSASARPPQSGLPLTKGNAGLLAAVDDVLAEISASGRITEILEEFGMPAEMGDVGEPRLVE